jgi:RimJ/RimL family protein N-acetyltransferase
MTLSVRQAAPADAECIAAWLNADWARTYLSSNLRGGAMTAALVRAGLRRADQSWHVVERAGRAAGVIVLDSIDREDGIANVWYALGNAAERGKGTMPAALNQLFAENLLRLHVVTAWIGAPNQASRRCLEKAGFRQIGVISGAFKLDGRRHDRVLFERVLGS